MHKLCGFALFWLAVGMIISMLIESTFFIVCIIILCLIIGFNLFCKNWIIDLNTRKYGTNMREKRDRHEYSRFI